MSGATNDGSPGGGAIDRIAIERVSAPNGSDVQAILALETHSFSNPWTPEALVEMLASDVTRVYVARDGERIVAFCACWVIAGELHINTLAVDRGARRRGIARKLLKHILDETAVVRATLEVRRSNTAAQKLYEGLGFISTAVRQRYYSNPDEDALILWLNS
ncbi:MAG TPA: ribosomal protein S18-alanine N-acetyltransferase [Vicinamibacterales bacterium]|nr:ribosomal protein S18-alanine N-acetyltransferase [Vicinamibacterales bacterium]